MITQLVSYKSSLCANSKLYHTIDIINSSTADLILFPGYTLSSHYDIYELNSHVKNTRTTAILEVKENTISELNPIRHSLFLLQSGIAKDMYTHQIFKDSTSISAHPELAEHLIFELETRRKFSIGNKNIAVIQCGENNILKNIQSEGNKTVFRFENNPKLHHRFLEFLNKTDIILNPIHSPMGNQPKMHKRREYFSNNNRVYFSTSNFDDENSINNKSIQYAYINGKKLDPSNIEIGKKNSYIIRRFNI